MLADAKMKDCHPKCLRKYRSRPRCNVKRLFAPNSHLAKLKTREVANITHLQNVDARRDGDELDELPLHLGRSVLATGGGGELDREGEMIDSSTMEKVRR